MATITENVDDLDFRGLLRLVVAKGWGDRQLLPDGVESIPVAWLEETLRSQCRKWLTEEGQA